MGKLKAFKKVEEKLKVFEVKKLKALKKAEEKLKALEVKKLKAFKKAALGKMNTADMTCQQQKRQSSMSYTGRTREIVERRKIDSEW